MSNNMTTYQQILDQLFLLKDEKYLQFNRKIVNTSSLMIGVRTPMIKQLAKEINKKDSIGFLEEVKNQYYEEDLLEGCVISHLKEPKLFDYYLHLFIPKINNWAVCDMCISGMKQMKKDEKYFTLAKNLIDSDQEFVGRAGYIIILSHFMNDDHIDRILELLYQKKNTQYYYVNMAKAWLISVCYVKFKDKTLKFLQQNKIDAFTHNKAIQKIIESYRVSKEDKEYLKTLKR